MLNSQFPSDKNWELRIEHWSDLLCLCVFSYVTMLFASPAQPAHPRAQRDFFRARRSVQSTRDRLDPPGRLSQSDRGSFSATRGSSCFALSKHSLRTAKLELFRPQPRVSSSIRDYRGPRETVRTIA